MSRQATAGCRVPGKGPGAAWIRACRSALSSHAVLALAPPPRSLRHPCCPLPRSPPALPQLQKSARPGGRAGYFLHRGAEHGVDTTEARQSPPPSPDPRARIGPTPSSRRTSRTGTAAISSPRRPPAGPACCGAVRAAPMRDGPPERLRPGWGVARAAPAPAVPEPLRLVPRHPVVSAGDSGTGRGAGRPLLFWGSQ